MSQVIAGVPAAVQPGPEPDRKGVREVEVDAAKDGEADDSGVGSIPRRGARRLLARGMRQLLPRSRISRFIKVGTVLNNLPWNR